LNRSFSHESHIYPAPTVKPAGLHNARGAVGRLENEGVIWMRGTAVQPHLKEFDTLIEKLDSLG